MDLLTNPFKTDNLRNNKIQINPKFNTVDDILDELHEHPIMANDDFCKHEIFELMSLNKLIFTNHSKLLEDLFKDNIYYFNIDNIDFTKKDFNGHC